jgi:hypothetical protein
MEMAGEAFFITDPFKMRLFRFLGEPSGGGITAFTPSVTGRE